MGWGGGDQMLKVGGGGTRCSRCKAGTSFWGGGGGVEQMLTLKV